MKVGAYKPTRRDRLAYRLATLALRLATPTYRNLCQGAWLYGLKSAARDELEGRAAPDVNIFGQRLGDPTVSNSPSWLEAAEGQE